MFKTILHELRVHAPFTFFGALVGIIISVSLQQLPEHTALTFFYIFHPMHVFFSAFATTSMFKLHSKGVSVFKIILIGYVGSIGIATLSDSVIPFIGESLFHLPNPELHIGFLEKWYVVNPIALFGIIMAMFFPATKLPHMVHVLLSTGASMFHVLASMNGAVSFWVYISIMLLLFIAVWIPSVFSDIIFPLFFIKNEQTVNLEQKTKSKGVTNSQSSVSD